MRSIRLSLLLYFLGLLALALGTASVLAYQTAEGTLQAKKTTTRKLLDSQYRDSCRIEDARLDEGLLQQAQLIAKLMRLKLDRHRSHYLSLHSLGLLTSQLAPNGYVLTLAWAASGIRNTSLSFAIHRRSMTEFKFNEDDLPDREDHPHDQKPPYYFQVDTVWGTSYRSHSLGDRHFPHDRPSEPGQVLSYQFEEVTLEDGPGVRRVLLKTPSSRFRTPLFIHCGFDESVRAEAHQRFQTQRDTKLAALETDTTTALADVRNRLLLIGSLTFMAALAGSVWLVRLGLSPLQRLSEAVSKVSPRDFQLPFNEKRLPAELSPIVKRLQGTLDLLKRAFAREKQATADISHELRTPLSVLLTTSELALRKPRSAEEYRELLLDCRLSAQQMNQIVQRLLTLARLDAGVDQLQHKTIDVSQLADQCLALVRPLAEARGVTLTAHKPASLALTGDPDKLREVLNNLLHNAIQYNKPHGHIDVRLGRENGHLEMEVRDTGIGIGPEARSQIFERFYRTDPSRSGDGMHAGLGLALVKEYVNLMSGSIDVESVLGQGSTFRVRLPV